MFKVLIVEDEEEIREGMVEIVNWKQYGFTVVGTARDGLQAIKLIDTLKPHLVITDIKMPNMDGLELLEHISKSKLHIKTIILTGYDDFSYTKKAINLGVLGYVSKLTLLDEIGSVLERAKNELSKNINQKGNYEEKLQLKNKIMQIYVDRLSENDSVKSLSSPSSEPKYNNWYCSLAIMLTSHSDKAPDPYELNRVEQYFSNYEASNNCSIFLRLRSNVFCICYFSLEPEKTASMAESGIQPLIDNVSKIINTEDFNITAGIGQCLYSESGCIRSIMDAQYCLSSRKLILSRIIRYKDIPQTKTIEDINPALKQIESQILSCVDIRSYNEITLYINKWLDILFTNERASIDSIRKACVILLSVLIWKVEDVCGSQNEKLNQAKNMISHLFAIENPLELRSNFSELVKETLLPLTEDITTQDNKARFEMACQYIEKHVLEQITLKQMALFTYMTPTYFSTLFKKNIGQTFSDYLSMVKMKKAFDLLKSGYSVSAVSQMLGYEEVKNFRTMFKKYYDVNPASIKKGIKE